MMMLLEALLMAQSLILPHHTHSYTSPTSTEITNHTVCPTTGDISIGVKSENGRVLVTFIKSEYRSSSTDDLSIINANLSKFTGARIIDVGCGEGESYITIRGVSNEDKNLPYIRVIFVWYQTGPKYFLLNRTAQQ